MSRIADCAFKFGVDPYFICAIRRHENGPADKEFGVLVGNHLGYDNQLRSTCITVRNKLVIYKSNPLFRRISSTGDTRVAYTERFIRWFGNIWAPIGATNDPTHLNENWPGGVTRIYYDLLQDPNALMRYSKNAQ